MFLEYNALFYSVNFDDTAISFIYIYIYIFGMNDDLVITHQISVKLEDPHCGQVMWSTIPLKNFHMFKIVS